MEPRLRGFLQSLIHQAIHAAIHSIFWRMPLLGSLVLLASAAGRFELRAHSPEQKEVTVVLSGVGFCRVAKSDLANVSGDLLADPEAPRLEGRVSDPRGHPVGGDAIAVTPSRGTKPPGWICST